MAAPITKRRGQRHQLIDAHTAHDTVGARFVVSMATHAGGRKQQLHQAIARVAPRDTHVEERIAPCWGGPFNPSDFHITSREGSMPNQQ